MKNYSFQLCEIREKPDDASWWSDDDVTMKFTRKSSSSDEEEEEGAEEEGEGDGNLISTIEKKQTKFIYFYNKN